MKKILCFFISIVLAIEVCGPSLVVKAANTTISSSTIADYFNSKVGTSVPQASCLAFIADGFASLGATRSSACCAYDYGSSHIVSTSMDNIPIGADVFFNWDSSYTGTWYTCPTTGNYCHHIGVYVGDGNVVHTSGGKVVKTSLSELVSYWKVNFRGWGYHGNVTVAQTNDPIGCVDYMTGMTGQVYLNGWAMDKDLPTTPVDIHVYIGSGADKECCAVFSANVYRGDVAEAYPGTGTNHGYEYTIYTNKTGEQKVEVYAINIGGGTNNTCIGSGTVYISPDTTAPTITNCQVTNVTSDGYTVTCNVEDNQGGTGVERVSFPTWSDVNGQDDLSADWYNACAVYPSGTGNTYTFNVNVANHGYAEGGYTTHIYAYDKAGNYSMEAVFATINRQIPLESFTLSQNQLNVAINQTEQLSVTSYTPSNTTSDKTATWQSSNASVVTVDGQGNVTGIKTGTATITCTVAGKTQSCEVTVSDVILKDFSGWVDCLPDEVSNNATKYEIQEKTQYRSRTKAETTSTTPNLSGWNVSNEWWGDWQQCGADVIGTATREVRQEQQYVKTQWAYNHWHNTSNGNVSPVQYSGWVYHETGWLDYQLTPSGTSNAGGTKYLCSSKIGPCSYQGPWYNETKQDVYNTLYYYRDKYFNYYQWSDWSDWSDAVVSASANVEIETRTLYRYRYNAVELLSNPDNQSVDLGETATFTVSATGIGLTYQWQYSKDDGKTWSNATVNDISYSIEATELMEGWLYRCVVTDGKGNSVTSESAKLTVKIPLKTYTITYNLKGGKNNKANPATYTEGSDTITLKAPTKTGYTFGGWYSDSSYKTKVIQINTVSNKDINLYAKWTANKYTIKFHKNGATSGSMNAMNNRKYGSSYTLSANKFKRKGYSFKDWNTKKNGSGKTYKNKESVKNLVSANGKSITLYAQWEKKSYKITYKLNGGTNKSTNPKQYDVTTKTITLKAPTRKGYTFEGWYKDSKFKKPIKKITKGSTGNITLYAKWEKK